MSTFTHTPAQSNFAESFKLNFPEGHKPDIGSVVGPNWCGEFFVVTGLEQLYDHEKGWTRAILEQLTSDRKDLLTIENRRDFVASVTAAKGREIATGFQKVPEWHEVREMKRAFQNALCIDIVVSILERKKAAAA